MKFCKGRKWIKMSMLNIFFKKSNNFTCTEIILTFNILVRATVYLTQ